MSAVTSFQTESTDMVKLHDMSVALVHQHVNMTYLGPLYYVNMTRHDMSVALLHQYVNMT